VKYILAILFSASLYAPDMARLVAYADYVVDVVSEEKVNICDCEGILKQPEKPSGHQEYMTVLKTEFKYTLTEIFTITHVNKPFIEQYCLVVNTKLPRYAGDIFEPPKV
jgi:hypothetical protein